MAAGKSYDGRGLSSLIAARRTLETGSLTVVGNIRSSK